MLGLSCTLLSWGKAQGWGGTSQAGKWAGGWGHITRCPVTFGPHYICPFPAAASPCAGSPSHSPMCRECGMGSSNLNWAGNSLLSCRRCNRKRKNLLVSISFVFDGCINFLNHEKTLHPKKSTSVESCCVSGSLGRTAASYASCHLCQLGACGKHLQSRGYFPTAEKSGTSS